LKSVDIGRITTEESILTGGDAVGLAFLEAENTPMVCIS